MYLLPITTPLLKPGDDLSQMLREHAEMHDGDIIVISSKAVAVCEGTIVDLSSLTISDDAQRWSGETKRSPVFMQAVLNETTRLHGKVIGSCPGALLTELRPDGLKIGTIFAPNAGMDESNIESGRVIGWPIDPVPSAKNLRESFNQDIGILISDSCCRPRRLGVTAFALTVAGFDPLKSEIGNTDLFGNVMRVTVEATADQLATAANVLMGNTAQSIPAVIIRDHGISMTDYVGWVDGIEPEEDLFRSIV